MTQTWWHHTHREHARHTEASLSLRLAYHAELIEINVCQDSVKFLHISTRSNLLDVFFWLHHSPRLLCLRIRTLSLHPKTTTITYLPQGLPRFLDLPLPLFHLLFQPLYHLFSLLHLLPELLIHSRESLYRILQGADLRLYAFQGKSLRGLPGGVFHFQQVQFEVQLETLEGQQSAVTLSFQ